jgi:hypothetical protein
LFGFGSDLTFSATRENASALVENQPGLFQHGKKLASINQPGPEGQEQITGAEQRKTQSERYSWGTDRR